MRVLILTLACSAALAAQAQNPAPERIDIPAGELVTALDALTRQSGVQFVYPADQLKGLRTGGVQGTMTAGDALDRLLRDSGYVARRDASGAIVIVKETAAAPPPRTPAASSGDDGGARPDRPVVELESVQVTGSRIPRAQIEGPAPITVITAEEIKANGFTSVPDVLRAMTQNGGETQSQQSASGADFSPGAQQVDLRGLGPNHTLVLVNGRRIADFPMPFKGRSNFTDISNIPLGMVERIEILTGSASAIYGSDAISGVVNFILKSRADGTTLDARVGDTTRGGGESYQLSLSSGFSSDRFNLVYGAELLSQRPLWAYDREIQDSTQDAPTARTRVGRRAYLRTNWYDEYLDPGAATCASLAGQNGGSTYHASRPGWGPDGDPGYYCGSDSSIGYGTMISERKGINGYASMSYAFDNDVTWFADVQAGYHELAMFRDVTQWSYMAPDGNEEGYFYNQATDQVEYWQRQFSPEEMGGLDRGMIRNRQKTLGITTGLKGQFATVWSWEAALSHSQYQSVISWPQIVAEKANALFLGPQLGVDEDGFPIFNADPSRLYRPLTRAEYDSIAARTTYNPKSRTDALSLTLTNTELFSLPAGEAGFAGTLEVGNQAYDLNPDPLATQYYYYSWRDSDGSGSRNRWAAAGELRLPLHDTLNASVAARYDQYRYAGHSIDKLTYSSGLEWRPVEPLLVRGSYGTAFRAPDLHYVFSGEGNLESSGADYYRCRTEEPDTDISDCSYGDEGVIVTRRGNRRLEPETSTAYTAGFVWSPLPQLDFSLDYFDINLKNQVQDLRIDGVLQDEASCRLGQMVDGTPVNPNSPTCIDALARVRRSADGSLYGVSVNPINIARERTSGIDFSTHYRLETGIGLFRLSGNYTWVRKHESQQYTGDRVEDQFAVNSGFDIPRTKASASVSWERNRWTATLHGERLGSLPNSDSYAQVYDPEDGGSPWIGATYRYNASVQYRFNDYSQLSFAVTNLFDKMPPKDPTATGYPYYDISWFDAVGRQIYVQYTHKFGGKAL